MKIGDKVRVVNSGSVYSTYQEMADVMGLSKFRNAENFNTPRLVYGDVLTISNIQPHLHKNFEAILIGGYCERSNEDFIIGMLGVEAVKDEPLSKLVAEQEAEIKKLKILLGEARCSNCYGDGANYDGHGEIHQCQWCDETKKILEANNETT